VSVRAAVAEIRREHGLTETEAYALFVRSSSPPAFFVSSVTDEFDPSTPAETCLAQDASFTELSLDQVARRL
jgi:hypothetical protein